MLRRSVPHPLCVEATNGSDITGVVEEKCAATYSPQMSRLIPLSVSLVAYLATPPLATTQCRGHFAAGAAPTMTKPKLKPRTQEVCFRPS